MTDSSPFPYDVRVDHASRTIVITGAGAATTAHTLELIRTHQKTFRDHPGYNVLYDAVALTIDSSAADMVSVATALFATSTSPIGRFAVVVPQRRAQLGMMFTALAQTHGINACVFTDREDACRWIEGGA